MHDSLVIKESDEHGLFGLAVPDRFLGSGSSQFQPLAGLGFHLQFTHTKPGFISCDDAPEEEDILTSFQVLLAHLDMQILLFLGQNPGNELWGLFLQLEIFLKNLVCTAMGDAHCVCNLAHSCPPVLPQ